MPDAPRVGSQPHHVTRSQARLGELGCTLLAAGAALPSHAQLMLACREMAEAPRAVGSPCAPVPSPTALCELREELRNAVGPGGEGAPCTHP